MELRDYVRIVRKAWWLIAAFLTLGVAVGAALYLSATPLYGSSTRLFVSVQSSDPGSTSEIVQGNSAAQQKVQSYVDVVTSTSVLSPVIEELGLDMSVASLSQMITAQSTPNTVLITISVVDVDARRAADIANATGRSLSDLVVNELEADGTGSPGLVQITMIEPASVASEPSDPNLRVNLLLGALVGAMIGIIAAATRHVMDQRVHGPHEIATITQAPILGSIRFDPQAKERPLVVSMDPRNPRSESFRTLRTNLRFVNATSDRHCFVVTSSVPAEGKTTTVANLAIALAETGAKVAVVDGDLRAPRLANTLALEGAAGLTDVLIGRARIDDVLQEWGSGNLHVLPAGLIPPNPSELLGSAAMKSIVDWLAEAFDYVLIDSPPLLPVTDAAVLAAFADGVIVVVSADGTKAPELASALRNIEHAGSRLLGIILTKLPTRGPDAYGDYGNYYGRAREETRGAPKPLSATPLRRHRSRR